MSSQHSLTLYPSKWKDILYLLISIVLSSGGVLMILDGEKIGWFVTIFFGASSLIFIKSLIRPISYLQLNERGFTVFYNAKSDLILWKEVSEFETTKVQGKKMVIFNFNQFNEEHEICRMVATLLVGADAALPDTYGKKAEELAVLMNEWKVVNTTK